MKIRVRSKSHYGLVRYYPICEYSRMLVDLLGQKSLSAEKMEIIRKHKVEIEIEK